MEIEITLHHSTLLVRLRGELDHHWVGQLREKVDQAMERDPVRNIIFNLQGLDFMDSSGIGVILGRYKRIRAQDGRMAICEASSAVSKVMEISGIPRIVPFFKTEADALEHLIMGLPPKRRS